MKNEKMKPPANVVHIASRFPQAPSSGSVFEARAWLCTLATIQAIHRHKLGKTQILKVNGTNHPTKASWILLGKWPTKLHLLKL